MDINEASIFVYGAIMYEDERDSITYLSLISIKKLLDYRSKELCTCTYDCTCMYVHIHTVIINVRLYSEDHVNNSNVWQVSHVGLALSQDNQRP